MIRFLESFAWCDFTTQLYKYRSPYGIAGEGASWFGTASGTLTGGIVAGPEAGTFGLKLETADGAPDFFSNRGWHQLFPLRNPTNQKTWIVAFWIRPEAISSRQTFFILYQGGNPSNQLAVVTLHLSAAGAVEVYATSANTRMNRATGDFVLQSAALPMGTWSHVCLVVNTNARSSGGSARLYRNGALDASAPYSNSAGVDIHQGAIVWENTGAAAVTLSQIVVADGLAPNNVAIAPAARVVCRFPSSDVSSGWLTSAGGSALAMVRENPGPDLDATYIRLPSLTFPDVLFGVSPLGITAETLAIAANVCNKGTSSQTLQAIARRAGVIELLGSSLVSAADYFTEQCVADMDPYTGIPWNDVDISGSQWGVRGISGGGERVTQFFLEQLVAPVQTLNYAY